MSISLSAADLNMTVGRKGTTPPTAEATVAALRDAVAEWEQLLKTERSDGGKIKAAGGKAVRFSKILVESYNADLDQLKLLVAGRGILTTSDADALKALGISTQPVKTPRKRSQG